MNPSAMAEGFLVVLTMPGKDIAYYYIIAGASMPVFLLRHCRAAEYIDRAIIRSIVVIVYAARSNDIP